MKVWLTAKIAFLALGRNKLRTVLTMLGIIIGVGAVITMLSIGNGAKAAMQKRLSSLGSNSIYVWAGFRKGRMRGEEGRRVPTTVEDWKAVARLPGVQNSSPIVYTSGSLVAGSASWSTDARGTTPQILAVENYQLTEGRMFSESEVHSAATVVVIGEEVRRQLFGAADPIGEQIRITKFPFTVIGLLKAKGSEGFGNPDDVIFIPYTTALQKLAGGRNIDSMSVEVKKSESSQTVEDLIIDTLNERHKITDPEDGGFRAFSTSRIGAMMDENTKIFTMLLGGIASISLLVGGIGVMNIMLVSVSERVKEIGIRMAIGARRADILGQFLMESVMLSLAGGFLGVLLGFGGAHLVATIAGWPSSVTEGSVVLAFGTSVAIGVFFGFYPAISASRLDPIQALRHE